MRICQHCGAGVPNYAGFCGECGQLINIDKPGTQKQTIQMSHSISPDEAQTVIVTEAVDESKNTGDLIEDEDTSKNPVAEVEEEDEDRRRRSALV
ncbi:MAG: hypothetical protein JO031_10530, partial [Ktedonobacteraceae bacterium]|nr:hypothetical protein [Ktedonobacteraceae bacterium]